MRRAVLPVLTVACFLLAAPRSVRAGQPQPADRLRKETEALIQAKRYDEALALCERTGWAPFDEYLQSEAQRRRTEILMQAGRTGQALAEARLCLAQAASSRILADRIRWIAEYLQKEDQNPERARAFILFQLHGPAGPDGRAGTGDELQDPLAAFPWPSFPERQAGCEDLLKTRGDSWRQTRLAALAALAAGRPRTALRGLIEAFNQCPGDHLEQAGREAVFIGVRAVNNHSANLQDYFDYLMFGPRGRDGVAGSADDQADPFAPLLDPVPFPAAALTDEERAALQGARALLQELAADEAEPENERKVALAGLARIGEALNDWGRPELRAWYLRRMVQEPRERLRAELLWGALAAVRGRVGHLGGWQELVGEYKTELRQEGLQSSPELARLEQQLNRWLQDGWNGAKQQPQVKVPPVKVEKPPRRGR